MATKIKKAKLRANSFAKNPHARRKGKNVDTRDLNEEDQQQITNYERDEFQNQAVTTDSNPDNYRSEDQNKPSIEDEEDREARRKTDEAQGKEQV